MFTPWRSAPPIAGTKKDDTYPISPSVPARRRRRTSAHAADLLQADRLPGEAEQPEMIEDDRGEQLAGDRRGQQWSDADFRRPKCGDGHEEGAVKSA